MNRVFITTVTVQGATGPLRLTHPFDTVAEATTHIDNVRRRIGTDNVRFTLRSVPERLPNLTR